MAFHFWFTDFSLTALVFGLAAILAIGLAFSNIWQGTRTRWHFILSALLLVSLWRIPMGVVPPLMLVYLTQSVFLSRLSEENLFRLLGLNFFGAAGMGFYNLSLALQIIVPAMAVLGFMAWRNNLAKATAQNFALVNFSGVASGFVFNFLVQVFGFRLFQSASFSGLMAPEWTELFTRHQMIFLTCAVFAVIYLFAQRRPRPPKSSEPWHFHFCLTAIFFMIITAICFTSDQYLENLALLSLVWLMLWGVPSMTLTGLQAKALAISGMLLMLLAQLQL